MITRAETEARRSRAAFALTALAALPLALLGWIGVLALAHRDADLAVARAAAARGVPFVFSNQASVAMEETAAAMGDAARWFQMYWSTEDDLVDSFLRRAAAVNAGALVVTLDTTMLGWRPRDLDLGSLPFARGEGIAQYTSDPIFRRLLDDVPAPGERPRVTPQTIRKKVRDVIEATKVAEQKSSYLAGKDDLGKLSKKDRQSVIARLEAEMKDAAKNLQFERAAELRDALLELKAE